MTYGLSFAAASVVSQGVAIALGIQDGFDWKQVGLAALSVVALPFGPISGASVIGTLFNSMVGNALAQGIGVLTGLQDHFSWTGVVAAGIGAGFGQTVGEALREANAFSELGKFGMNVAQGTVRGLTAGLTTAALRGGRVSVMQVAADAFGSALGYGLADAMQQAPDSPYSLAYGMRSSVGLKADPGVWNDGVGSDYGSYQPEDLSLTANGTPRLPMQMGDGTSNSYNPAADPEVQARAQRFLERNPIAANDVADPSLPVVTSDSGQYGFPIPNLNDYPDRVLPNYVVTPDAKAVAEANQSWADTQPLTAVGTSTDGGLVWNTGTVSYSLMAPEIEVTTPPDTGTQPSPSAMQGQPSLLKRFGTGVLGALESVTIEPVRQIGDLGKAGASVFYNELIRKDGDPYWFRN